MEKGIYLIPNGPKNLAILFPSIDWSNVKDYYIQLTDEDDAIVMTSRTSKLCSCTNDEGVRIHFLNYCGTYDTVNFLKPKVIHEPTSSEYQKTLDYPLQKTDTGIERFNLKSNDTYEIRRNSQEEEMPWLQELVDSPKCFLEWTGIEGQPDSYLPIVVVNTKMEKIKNLNEYNYDFVLTFKLANEYILIRN